MLKRGLLVGGILLVAVLLLGCGIPKADYEAVVAERDSALADLQSVQSQLNSAQAEVSDLSSELQEKQQQLSDIEQILDSLEHKFQMQYLLAEFSNKCWWYDAPNSALSWEVLSGWVRHTFRVDMENHLRAVDDTALCVLYEDAITWKAEGWTTDHLDFDALLARLDELIEDDIDELRAILAD